MRWLIATASALALMTASAHAQIASPNGTMVPGSGIGDKAAAGNAKASQNDPAKPKANEKAYNAALQNLPNKQYDPWHGVR
jgi:hypothetical protein